MAGLYGWVAPSEKTTSGANDPENPQGEPSQERPEFITEDLSNK